MTRIPVQTLHVDATNARLMLGEFGHRAPNAISGAINETLLEVRTAFRRDIRRLINISQRSLDSRIHITRSRPLSLTGEIRLSHERRPGISPTNFAARQTARGVSYRIGPLSRRGLIPGAFIRSANGNEHVFVRYRAAESTATNRRRRRRPSGINYDRVPRYRLRRVLGVSPWGAYTRAPNLLRRHVAEAQTALNRNAQQRVRFEILRGTGQINRPIRRVA